MSQLHRFYVPDLTGQPQEVRLPDEERHHALNVVRVRAGDRVQLFDGAGAWCNAQVVAAGSRKIEIQRGTIEKEPPSESRLTLAQAWLNHERNIENIIEQGTALGVDRFLFFRAAHSERAPRGEEKWTRWAVESCKQCGRARLPQFDFTLGIQNCLAFSPGWDIVLATQHVRPVALEQAIREDSRVMLVIGPEGDLRKDEVEQALAAGARPISLGPKTLRSHLAATVAVTLVQRRLGRI